MQKIQDKTYLIDLKNEKTYVLNYEGEIINKCIENNSKSLMDIYVELGGDKNNINQQDFDSLQEFINAEKDVLTIEN